MSKYNYLLIVLVICYFLCDSAMIHARSGAAFLFIENRGQLTDQHHQPRKDLDFSLRASGLTLYVGAGRLHYQFVNPERDIAVSRLDPGSVRYPFSAHPLRRPAAVFSVYRLDMELVGADLRVKPVPGNKHAYYEQYRTGEFRTGLRGQAASWQQVTYPDIYPGIDWVLYVKDGQVKYDFILREGADPSQIRIRYAGAEQESLRDDGSLQIATPKGMVTENAPVAWTQRDHTPVACKFVRKGNEWTFITEPYTGSLVIDPLVQWGTYFGGSDMETQDGQISTITSDATGRVYVAGQTSSIDLIATTGAHQTTLVGGNDIYLARFHPDGSLDWSTYYGGDQEERVCGIAAGITGHVYLSGFTNSGSGIATTGAHQSNLSTGGMSDNFLAQFDSSGNLVWGTYLGDINDESGGYVATDGSGNVYLSGTTLSSDGIATPGTYQPVKPANPNGDAFIVKFNFAGQRVWGSYFGGPGLQSMTSSSGIAIAPDNAIYMTGMTQAIAGISTQGVHQTDLAGEQDAYIVRFDTAGQRVWGTYYGGSLQDRPVAITVGPAGDVFIGGVTLSDTGIATTGTSRSGFNPNTMMGGLESFLARFDGNGRRIWGTYVGPEMGELTGGICADLRGNVYVSGATMGVSNIMITPDAHQSLFGGGADGFLLRYGFDSGLIQYSTYYGGSDMDMGNGVHVDQTGNVYLYGTTQSTNGIATVGVHQDTYGGGSQDMFLVKFLVLDIDPSFPDTTLCIGREFLLPGLPSSAFNSGNVFDAELSDQTGSFSSPVVIGTYTAVNFGTISCIIPAGTSPGTGYRIRITSSAPAMNSSYSLPVNLILPPPVPVVTVNGMELSSDASAGNQWWLNGAPVPGADNQTYTVSATGWYSVAVYNGGCSSMSDSVQIFYTGVGKLPADQKSVHIYPSPFGATLSVEIDASVSDIGTYRLTVTDITGRMVYEQDPVFHHNELDLGHLTAGVYLVAIRGTQGNVTMRALKQ